MLSFDLNKGLIVVVSAVFAGVLAVLKLATATEALSIILALSAGLAYNGNSSGKSDGK